MAVGVAFGPSLIPPGGWRGQPPIRRFKPWDPSKRRPLIVNSLFFDDPTRQEQEVEATKRFREKERTARLKRLAIAEREYEKEQQRLRRISRRRETAFKAISQNAKKKKHATSTSLSKFKKPPYSSPPLPSSTTLTTKSSEKGTSTHALKRKKAKSQQEAMVRRVEKEKKKGTMRAAVVEASDSGESEPEDVEVISLDEEDSEMEVDTDEKSVAVAKSSMKKLPCVILEDSSDTDSSGDEEEIATTSFKQKSEKALAKRMNKVKEKKRLGSMRRKVQFAEAETDVMVLDDDTSDDELASDDESSSEDEMVSGLDERMKILNTITIENDSDSDDSSEEDSDSSPPPSSPRFRQQKSKSITADSRPSSDSASENSASSEAPKTKTRPVSKGKVQFSLPEKVKLQDKVAQYQALHGLSKNEIDTLVSRNRQRKTGEVEAFWTFVSLALPTRTLRGVVGCVRLLRFQKDRKNWTDTQVKKLKAAYKDLGNKWSQVSERVGRSPQACKDRWYHHHRGNAENRGVGLWKRDEEQRLKAGVQALGAQWFEVSKIVQTRTAGQCYQHWSEIISYPQVVPYTVSDRGYLVAAVKKVNPRHVSEVNWTLISRDEDSAPAIRSRGPMRLRSLFRTLEKQAYDQGVVGLKEQLIWLSRRYPKGEKYLTDKEFAEKEAREAL